jgi:hypothetical protein
MADVLFCGNWQLQARTVCSVCFSAAAAVETAVCCSFSAPAAVVTGELFQRACLCAVKDSIAYIMVVPCAAQPPVFGTASSCDREVH